MSPNTASLGASFATTRISVTVGSLLSQDRIGFVSRGTLCSSITGETDQQLVFDGVWWNQQGQAVGQFLSNVAGNLTVCYRLAEGTQFLPAGNDPWLLMLLPAVTSLGVTGFQRLASAAVSFSLSTSAALRTGDGIGFRLQSDPLCELATPKLLSPSPTQAPIPSHSLSAATIPTASWPWRSPLVGEVPLLLTIVCWLLCRLQPCRPSLRQARRRGVMELDRVCRPFCVTSGLVSGCMGRPTE